VPRPRKFDPDDIAECGCGQYRGTPFQVHAHKGHHLHPECDEPIKIVARGDVVREERSKRPAPAPTPAPEPAPERVDPFVPVAAQAEQPTYQAPPAPPPAPPPFEPFAAPPPPPPAPPAAPVVARARDIKIDLPKPTDEGVSMPPPPMGTIAQFHVWPKVLDYYDFVRQAGYDQSLEELMNEATVKWFESKGWTVAVVPRALLEAS
jgi:hypothetical protein